MCVYNWLQCELVVVCKKKEANLTRFRRKLIKRAICSEQRARQVLSTYQPVDELDKLVKDKLDA